ncbi:MAG: hypothetical protein GY720_11840 [bacterium]|nr:hypothetical protein [bacterium]
MTTPWSGRRVVGAIVVLALGAAACDSQPETPGTTTTIGATSSAAPRTTAVVSTTVPPNARGLVAGYLADPAVGDLQAVAGALTATGVGPESLGDFLDAASLFPDAPAGRETIAAAIGFNQHRQVRIRTPDGYDPDQRYPTIIAYHTWGGTADRIIDRFEMLLGDRIEEFIVAAPDDYRQTILDAPPPVSSEHVSVWRAVRRARHVDSDRLYVMGYSLGGETVMTTTALHGHHVAGAIGMANSFAFPSDVPGLWEWFAGNLGDTPLLHVWGAEDTTNIPGLNGRDSPARMASLNRQLVGLLSDLRTSSYTPVEIEGLGHSDVYPPQDLLWSYLEAMRGPVPSEISHTFRFIHQADTAWVEGHEWEGEGWLAADIEYSPREGESEREAEARAIHDLLGRIAANVADNRITVTTTHLADFTIWLDPSLVDLGSPVTVVHNGSTVFEGTVAPDVGVALGQAVRSGDLDRIRHGGIRIVDGVTHVVTTADVFPDIVRGISLG